MFSAALSRPVQRKKSASPCHAKLSSPPLGGPLSAAGVALCTAPVATPRQSCGDASSVNSDRESTHRPVGTSVSNASCGRRLFELVIYNYTDKEFCLSGPSQPGMKKIPVGRLLRLESSLRPATSSASATAALSNGLLPAYLASTISSLSPDPEVPPVAQATFGSSAHSSKEDALEFTLSFMDTSNTEGFTVRVHAHERSPLKSDALPAGQGLDVSSAVEAVPRIVLRPPPGYAETVLGVYRNPERDEGARLGTIQEGDEVMPGGLARDGRWIHISSPVDGWIQARTRDGQSLLDEVEGQPNVRQVVSIRLRRSEPPVMDRAAANVMDPLAQRAPQPEPWDAELAHFRKSAALNEVGRLDKEAASMEAVSLLGIRTRKTLVGALYF